MLHTRSGLAVAMGPDGPARAGASANTFPQASCYPCAVVLQAAQRSSFLTAPIIQMLPDPTYIASPIQALRPFSHPRCSVPAFGIGHSGRNKSTLRGMMHPQLRARGAHQTYFRHAIQLRSQFVSFSRPVVSSKSGGRNVVRLKFRLPLGLKPCSGMLSILPCAKFTGFPVAWTVIFVSLQG